MARQLGLRRFRTSQLHDPETSLAVGTLYLRQMLDRFDGRVERALAAYNAGPHRVEAWTAGRPGIGTEEFIETIPFTETRTYVKIVLGAREQYRRVYGLPTAAPATPTTGQ
jgi:soluble lytic murein transglycosylase